MEETMETTEETTEMQDPTSEVTQNEIEIPVGENSPYSRLVLRENAQEEPGNGFFFVGWLDIYVNIDQIGEIKLDTLRVTLGTPVELRIRQYKTKEGNWVDVPDAKVAKFGDRAKLARAITRHLPVLVTYDGLPAVGGV